MCRDANKEDKRNITFECSYLNTAVLEPILSNSKPVFTINFAKKLNGITNYAIDTISK